MSSTVKNYGKKLMNGLQPYGKQLMTGLQPIVKQLAKDAASKGLTIGGDVANIIASQLKSQGATGDVVQQVRQLIVKEVGDYAKTQGKDVGNQVLGVVKEVASHKTTGRNVADLLSKVGSNPISSGLPIQSAAGRKRNNNLHSQCNPIGQIEHNGKCIGILTNGGHIVSTKASKLVSHLPIYNSNSL
jgi:hypothetical protein